MEQKPKNREWVKNAAIIFLAVMLVLTFFSNTILNRTLPEVVTRYVEPGSIDSKVRVSGTVSARENYDVIIEQTRKVAACENGPRQTDDAGAVVLLGEDVAMVADVGRQAHDKLLADGVDRRVGHLRETLLEVIE